MLLIRQAVAGLLLSLTVLLLLACSDDKSEPTDREPATQLSPRAALIQPAPTPTPTLVGSPLPVPAAASPLASGDIVFLASDGMYKVRPDGSGLTRLASSSASNVSISPGSVSMSPDGAYFAWSEDAPGARLNRDVFVGYAPDGSDRVNITNSPDGREFPAPVWSPDGSMLAYVVEQGRTGTLLVMNRDGSQKLTIATITTWYGLAWLPDGRSLAALMRIGVQNEGGQNDVVVFSIDGRPSINVTNSAEDDNWSYGLSNRGDRLAWVVQQPYHFFVDSIYGSARREILPPAGSTIVNGPVVWSPSDNRIAMLTSSSTGNRMLTSVDPNTGTMSIVAADLHFLPEYRWSADGSQLIYLSSGGPCREGCPAGYLNIVNADGTDAHKLTDLRVGSILGWLK